MVHLRMHTDLNKKQIDYITATIKEEFLNS